MWGSSLSGSTSAPSRTTLSPTIAVPGRELERGAQVGGVVGLVGVDEDQIERAGVLVDQCRQAVRGRPDPDLDAIGDPRASEVAPRHLGIAGVDLQRDEAPVVRERSREPDRAVAAQGADLQHAPVPGGDAPR